MSTLSHLAHLTDPVLKDQVAIRGHGPNPGPPRRRTAGSPRVDAGRADYLLLVLGLLLVAAGAVLALIGHVPG